MQLRTLIAPLLLASASGTSQAAFTLYTSEAAYLAAVGATIDYVDFNPSPDGGARVSGFSFSNVSAFGSCKTTTNAGFPKCQFEVNHSSNAITDLGDSTAPNGVASLLVDVGGPSDPNARGPLQIPFAGVGFKYVSGLIAALQLFDGFGETFGSVDTSAAGGFIGVVSDVPLTRLTFIALNAVITETGGNDRYFIDDFRVNAPIPEPSTYGLLALGLAGIGLAARRRRAT